MSSHLLLVSSIALFFVCLFYLFSRFGDLVQASLNGPGQNSAAWRRWRKHSVDLLSAKAAIKAAARKAARDRFEEILPATHHYRNVCDGKPLPPDPSRSSDEERALRHLRVDRHPKCLATLARWQKRDEEGELVDGTCPDCPGEMHTAAHVLCECTKWQAERREHLGMAPTVGCLHSTPNQSINYLRAIGFLREPPIWWLRHRGPQQQQQALVYVTEVQGRCVE
jgi:hypothetical protein